MVVDGQPGAEYDWASDVTFSPDGKRFAYVASIGQTYPGTKWLAVVDGRPSEEYVAFVIEPTFSPDSKHVAYEAKKGEKYLIVLDGQPGTEYNEIFGFSLTFRPDGVLEYLAAKDHSLYRVKYIPVP